MQPALKPQAQSNMLDTNHLPHSLPQAEYLAMSSTCDRCGERAFYSVLVRFDGLCEDCHDEMPVCGCGKRCDPREMTVVGNEVLCKECTRLAKEN